MNFISPSTQRSYSFPCFDDKELKMQIPSEYKGKIIELSCDDDIMTDDEHIKGAIKKLHSSLTESAEKRSKPAAI